MLTKKISGYFLCVVLLITVLSACQQQQSGVLRFVANGEDFIRKGFVSKDGWEIKFEHAYIHLKNIKGYQADPPYDPTTKQNITSEESVGISGPYTIDLAKGDGNADPILIDEVEAPTGHYNAVSWEIATATDGEMAGHSLLLIGEATKKEQTIPFKIGIDKEYITQAGEFIGDERKGYVDEGQTGGLELTFHFDHLFGDGELPAGDELNQGAIGFDPFAALAKDGSVDITMAELKEQSPAIYETLLHIMISLGHVGEGHAYTTEQHKDLG